MDRDNRTHTRTGGPPPRSHGVLDGAQRGAFTIAMIRGIPIRLHWTLAVVLIYFAWVFSMRFGLLELYRARPVGAPFAWGLLVALGLFLGVLLHELGHAFTARAFGARVSSITLTFFGGISEIPSMPRPGWKEAVVAGMGPGVSLVLAGLAYLGSQLVNGTVHPELDLSLKLLAGINLMLAAFNLLPAFPLDGGRVLRSLLTPNLGRLRATEIAARVGQGLAVLLGVLAIFGNLFLLIIAFLIWMMADAELRAERLRITLRGLRVRDLMEPDLPLCVDAAMTVDEVAQEMARARRVLALVCTGDRVLGVVEASDLRRLAPEVRPRLRATEVARELPLMDQDLPAEEAAIRLQSEHAALAAVCDEGGRLVGILTPEGILRSFELAGLSPAAVPSWPPSGGRRMPAESV
jgi:Zn-dependent protease/CBS domain-containing protein